MGSRLWTDQVGSSSGPGKTSSAGALSGGLGTALLEGNPAGPGVGSRALREVQAVEGERGELGSIL